MSGTHSHSASIERSNRKGMNHVQVQLTVTESTAGKQSWSGEFMSRSVDGILPDERLSLVFESGQMGMARVSETSFDSRTPEATRVLFKGISPLV